MKRRDLVVLAAAAAAVALAGRQLTRFAVAEDSMAPTLRDGDWVLAMRPVTEPRRGAVVLFPHPRRAGFTLVKRVIGLPGEVIEITDGRVVVDGRPLPEPWAAGTTTPQGTWRLKPGEVFVLGDNRRASADDSRMLGPIPAGSLEWRLACRYWPPPGRRAPSMLGNIAG